MARGIGYAGEGDLFTASLVSSLLSVFPETSFSEMFCPDWAGNEWYQTLGQSPGPGAAQAAPIPRQSRGGYETMLFQRSFGNELVHSSLFVWESTLRRPYEHSIEGKNPTR